MSELCATIQNVHNRLTTESGVTFMENTIGETLVELRGDRTQEEVAKAIGVTKSAISMYENNERIPRDEIKRKMAAYFNVSVERIFFAERVHL
ncbi:MAG: helix-turn-helix transcriptional regulator [Peptococcus niger]